MTAVNRSGSALASLPLPFLPLCLPVLQKYPDPVSPTQFVTAERRERRVHDIN